MPGEARRLQVGGERGNLNKEWTNSTYVGKSFPTTYMLTLVRFLSSMCSDMYRQSATLNEAFPTARPAARVRPFIRMDSIVSL